jgi:hypothetical protein
VDKEPEPLPPIGVLVDLTLDLQLAEGPMARVPQELKDSIGLVVREKIADKHGISREYLDEIMLRLQLNPVLNVQVYDSMIVRLAKMKKKKSIKE